MFPVYHEGRRIGSVTSACHSPRLEKNIGFVNVPASRAAPGTRLTVDAAGKRLAATVVPTPFVESERQIRS